MMQCRYKRLINHKCREFSVIISTIKIRWNGISLSHFDHWLTASRVTLYTAGHLHTAVPHCSHSRAPIVHTAVPRENNEHGCVNLRCRAVCKLPGCVEGHPWAYNFRWSQWGQFRQHIFPLQWREIILHEKKFTAGPFSLQCMFAGCCWSTGSAWDMYGRFYPYIKDIAIIIATNCTSKLCNSTVNC